MSFLQGLFGPPNVEKMKSKRDFEGLIKALSYQKDEKVRARAANALGQLGDHRAVEPLIAVLKDSDINNRYVAAIALSRLGDSRAIELLIAALNAGYAFMWTHADAVEALVTIGTPSVEPLIDALMDKSKTERKSIVEALVKIGSPSVQPLIKALWFGDSYIGGEIAAGILGKLGDPRAIQPLIGALQDDNDFVRRAALAALDELKWQPGNDADGARYWLASNQFDKCVAIGAPAVGPLIAALKKGSEDAAEALGKIGNSRAIEPLIAALKDSYWPMRVTAAKALGKIGDSRAIEPLIAALRDEENYVRRASIEALVKLGDPRAVAPLIAVLEDSQFSEWEPAIEALGNLGDPRAIEICLLALKDRVARRTSAPALYKLGWRPGKDEDGTYYWIAMEEWEKCVEIGVPAIKPLIAELNSTFELRRAAAETLIKIYRTGQLDDYYRDLIVQQRPLITQPVTYKHWKSEIDENVYQTITNTFGIGLDFPL